LPQLRQKRAGAGFSVAQSGQRMARLPVRRQSGSMVFSLPAQFSNDRENSHRGDQIIYVIEGKATARVTGKECEIKALALFLRLFRRWSGCHWRRSGRSMGFKTRIWPSSPNVRFGRISISLAPRLSRCGGNSRRRLAAGRGIHTGPTWPKLAAKNRGLNRLWDQGG
jgi:hypothetical protein